VSTEDIPLPEIISSYSDLTSLLTPPVVLVVASYLKPNSITLASSELAPNMFEAGSCQIPLHYSWFGASSELAPNMLGASSELASVVEFGFYAALKSLN